MVTAKVAPEHCLALARAASQHASAAHAPGHAALWLAVIGLAAACLAAYRVSLWLHPFTLCRRCGGTGITAGFFPWSRAICRKCGGRGLVPRLGTLTADRGDGTRGDGPLPVPAARIAAAVPARDIGRPAARTRAPGTARAPRTALAARAGAAG